ncbi:hypothetical protein GCM10010329_74740 [Streptomyces spiroverticillatus]|uniref:Family 1 glycosylhydrolase n=1 Tax=Streptomyces finlayi TaxID=67296 RepID=A0A918X7B1_9ACTN|nr:hypothetical protein [Streptomyces finlayi]GHA40629.1 hypothetical protein GCM10010329_74740 [Streptomyces spiroverticillatus]GHD15361.1 hypothetical protein GCM10010334_75330 [Streptomyces finlayi]
MLPGEAAEQRGDVGGCFGGRFGAPARSAVRKKNSFDWYRKVIAANGEGLDG